MSQKRNAAGQRNDRWLDRSGFFGLSICSILLVTAGHVALTILEYGGCAMLSERVLDSELSQWYAFVLLHGPWVAYLPIVGLLVYLRATRQAWRMRFAICWLILFGITFGYVCAYHWASLGGSDSPAETLGNIGLAALGPATLLFVIWRGRLQGQANQIARNQSLPERYQRAAQLLRNDDPLVSAGGVHVIEQIGSEFRDYRQLCIERLTKYADQHDNAEAKKGDVATARAAVKRLEERR